MAEEPLPDTAPNATRVLFATAAFLLLMLGGELMVEKEGPRYWPGIPLLMAGLACSYAAVFWRVFRKILTNTGRQKVAVLATSPTWWFGMLLVTALVITLSPFVEQHRWPFAWQFQAQGPPPPDQGDATI